MISNIWWSLWPSLVLHNCREEKPLLINIELRKTEQNWHRMDWLARRNVLADCSRCQYSILKVVFRQSPYVVTKPQDIQVRQTGISKLSMSHKGHFTAKITFLKQNHCPVLLSWGIAIRVVLSVRAKSSNTQRCSPTPKSQLWNEGKASWAAGVRLPTTQETWVRSLGGENPLEKEMATTPELLPGKPHRQRSLVGYSLWGHKELDTTEQLPV